MRRRHRRGRRGGPAAKLKLYTLNKGGRSGQGAGGTATRGRWWGGAPPRSRSCRRARGTRDDFPLSNGKGGVRGWSGLCVCVCVSRGFDCGLVLCLIFSKRASAGGLGAWANARERGDRCCCYYSRPVATMQHATVSLRDGGLGGWRPVRARGRRVERERERERGLIPDTTPRLDAARVWCAAVDAHGEGFHERNGREIVRASEGVLLDGARA